ncbi:hypothetical protein [Actinomadura logoneensis]|uniref:hypothetical protein n=1 Tax=Actinomadura logoneensis TaxID=2293572 RepID=UPI0011C17CA9|nr:hypothetical protein [Actinomadura logoneensis]
MISGCGGSHKKDAKTKAPSPTSATPSPVPTFNRSQVNAALLKADDIRSGIKQIPVVLDQVRENKLPLCSLTGMKLPGTPQLITRQFTNKVLGKDQFQYTQLVALYADAGAASAAFSTVTQALGKCPAKHHAPPRQLANNRTVLAHDDTWKSSNTAIGQWPHVQAIEQQTVSPDATKYNAYHFIYDYAWRGNLMFASVYVQRTAPKDSTAPIIQQASGILQKQLGKFG